MKLISLLTLFLLSSCAIWIKNEDIAHKEIYPRKNLKIIPTIEYKSVIDIPQYKPTQKEIKIITNLEKCIDAGGSLGSNLKNAYQRRMVCEIEKFIPKLAKNTHVEILNKEPNLRDYYLFEYLIDEHESTLKKVNYWATILTLGIIPMGTSNTKTLKITEIKNGKKARSTTFSSETFLLAGVLAAPLYIFSDGLDAVEQSHTNLLTKFVNWL